MKKINNLLINLLLIVVSILSSLLLAEIGLRLACPKYKYAAEAKFLLSQTRIWQNPRNTRAYQQHPDLKKEHLIIYNSLGSRQHREFSPKKAEKTIRIGFFGDSFTANIRMAAQYSFTEPLEYLLNKTGAKYEILNFGTDGYGTDQSFLQYLQEGIQADLDAVFYVYCKNDVTNIQENQLLTIDKEGNFETIKYVTHPFVKFTNKLYLTYLVLDVNNNLKNVLYDMGAERYRSESLKKERVLASKALENDLDKGLGSNDVDRIWRIYFTLISQWEKECKKNIAKFYVATVPHERDDNMAGVLMKKGFKALNLSEKITAVYRNEEYKFENNTHWNEEGNKLAAIFLFKYLAKELDIAYSGDEFIEQGLYEYYSSFSPSRVSALFLKKHNDFPANLNQDIRSRYLSLE